jgi:predicted nucleotidyltransferase component of viral defense system
MILHHKKKEFEELVRLTSEHIQIPIEAVQKDYFITMVLNNLSNSEYVNEVVFKGGTSLSKCYPGSIERFSEDIDLTYIPKEGMTDKQISIILKSIENCLINNTKSEIIREERNNRNKSTFVWFNDDCKNEEKIKLEIGSSVRPHPFSKKTLKSYIHEYLLFLNEHEAIQEYRLTDVELNVLNIERTFIDKLFSVKRHAICGSLTDKVRHIYDVVKLYQMSEIKEFLENKRELKQIVKLTKETDSIYLEKRNVLEVYNSETPYDFLTWKDTFNKDIRKRYESLHQSLLYTNEQQDFDIAVQVFEEINERLDLINE